MNGLTQDALTELTPARECNNAPLFSSPRTGVVWPLVGAVRNGAEEGLVRLVRTIETEIIPRLMLAHRAVPGCPPLAPSEGGASGLAEDVAEFGRLVLAHDIAVASAYVAAMRAQGMSLETLYIDLLAPTARRLGELWEADLCDYAELALGLWRLQHVLRELSPAFAAEVQLRSRGRNALLASAPGEQHMLGIFMVSEFFRCVASEFFRRAGWDVWGAPPASRHALLDIVHAHWFDVVELSVSCEGRLQVLAEDILSIRRASRNPAVGVMVGGPVFVDHPEFVALVGADAPAADARQALFEAEKLVALQSKCG